MKNAIAISVVVLVGCGQGTSASGEPGFETGPCVDYQCLGGELVCLSDLCVDPNNMTGPDSDGDGSTSDPDTGDVPGERTREVDVLFVIDNSGSMGDEQATIVQGIGAFVAALDEAEADWRIGVTTTDDGNPWCGSTSAEAGRLVLSSCRGRTGEFVFNGNPPADATSAACTSVCSLDEVSITATAIEGDTEQQPRPWIESNGGASNLGSGVDAVEALRCVLPQGIAGCGFESQLESAHKAILRSQEPTDAQYGFARSSAMLVIVIVSDENDCSYTDGRIFRTEADGGTTIFWSDPDASAPSSAVCWNAGVECSGSGTPYDECHAANKSLGGDVGVIDGDAVLVPLSRYVDSFQEIEDTKKTSIADRDVLIALITGVPQNYDGNNLVYSNSLDPVEQGDFGIGAGCTYDDGDPMTPPATARPPVREREVAEAFTVDDRQNLFSICQEDLGTPLEAIASQITSRLGPAD